MVLLVAVLAFAAFAIVGWRFGADSRDGRDWQPYAGPGAPHSGTSPVISGGTPDGR